MKGFSIYIILFLFLAGNNLFTVKGENRVGPEVELQDSTDTPIIQELPIGRFDRGIYNYLFVPKGSIMFGTTFSWVHFDSNESEILSIVKDLNANIYTFRVSPHVSYFFRDNMSAGLRVSYNRTVVELDNVHIEFDDDVDISINDVLYRQHMFTGTGFVRSYIGLTPGKRFGLFNETSISFSGGSAKFITGEDDDFKRTYSQVRQLNLGLKPGLAVFIMNNACVEVSFGVAGLNYRKETQITNGEEKGSTRYSGANFKINLFDINIGITICI